ncbi:MAG: signal peptidase II [Gammaproteobacteria bacterium]|nr:signal peptidase II [Gammaproteobacteria bacterium]MYD75070.1 signal peptidase II [Gammaproteobacteria bacterium]MYJ52526.1 signal peptidase II [Gammaproteobacteria bacterium]
MNRVARYSGYLALSAALVGLDQIVKHLAIARLLGSPPVEVLPFLEWHLVYNTGAAFGFLHDAGGVQHYLFTGIAAVVSAAILVWLWRLPARSRLLSWALILVLAGGVGNLIDRIRYRHVVDFINLHYQDWYFPAFNVADMAITFGVICFLLDALSRRNEGSG